jgi:NAD(P)-dependent dehydrogenase (short-subunit alcohol dehydrogenase family)
MTTGPRTVRTRTAVVTGGASGIGRRTVERLLQEGWRVWVFDLAREPPHVGVPSIEKSAMHYESCDLRNPDDIARSFERVAATAGAIDALVCSAGVTKVGELEHTSLDDANLLLDVNLKGPWLTIRAAVPLLRKNARPDDPSRVVVIGSIAGMRPKIASGMYGASKAAAHVLAQIYAVELGPAGITVNVVAPGSTNTGMNATAIAEGVDVGFKPSGLSPLGRIAEPDDVASAVLFLLGQQAKYINGAILPVDGGTRAAYINR